MPHGQTPFSPFTLPCRNEENGGIRNEPPMNLEEAADMSHVPAKAICFY